jgi:hypothetical protein
VTTLQRQNRIVDEFLGRPTLSIIDELEPLFQELIHDGSAQAALARGELPAAADGLRLELQYLVLSMLPATVEELADRIVEYAEDHELDADDPIPMLFGQRRMPALHAIGLLND